MAENYEELLQFIYQAPVGLIQANVAGDVSMMTPKAVQLLMPISEQAEIRNVFDALSSTAPELRHLTHSFQKKRGIIVERRRCPVVDTSGQTTSVLELAINKLAKDRLVFQIQDVSELVKRENEAMLNAHMMEAIVENIQDQKVCVLDQSGDVVSWYGSGTRLNGYTEEDVLGHSFEEIAFIPDDLRGGGIKGWKEFLANVAHTGAVRIQGTHRRKEGPPFWAESVITPLRGAIFTQARFLVVTRDITAEREQAIDLERRASTDPLTGALNRRAFFDQATRRIEELTASGKGYCVGLLDIDHFKRLNDTYGHASGDRALTALVQACERCVRESDLVCRFGGEEFLFFLPAADIDLATSLSERLRQAIAGIELSHEDQPVRFTASIGIAASQSTETLEQVIERADNALYAAKRGGRDRVEVNALAA